MSFIAKLFMPKMPPVPQFIMPEVKDVPEIDSPEEKARLAEEMRRAENKRMGRRSTILTTSSGLNDEDAEISEKTLLG
jgi:hypothetical protein|tara:strand:- start:901 stop:1134 length:234 start_codon:yes stop_codon:yes gene_type:complete